MFDASQLEIRFGEDCPPAGETCADPALRQRADGIAATMASRSPGTAPALPAAVHAPFLAVEVGIAAPRLQHRMDAVLKRLFDIGFALAFLAVALPFVVVLVAALQWGSPGPLFFVQRRVGRGGELFGCIKLRTMRVDADAALARLLAACPASRAEWEADHKLRNDPRVSPIGRLVRKLSLDELPQLINIVRGEMSVVGPRPIVPDEVPKYGAAFADYRAVKPGLTGLWQVSGRNNTTYAARVRLDSEYRRRANFLFDIKIVLRTVPAVLCANGSY